MNATKWHTLTDFVKYLGREGYCIVDETPKVRCQEKGWNSDGVRVFVALDSGVVRVFVALNSVVEYAFVAVCQLVLFCSFFVLRSQPNPRPGLARFCRAGLFNGLTETRKRLQDRKRLTKWRLLSGTKRNVKVCSALSFQRIPT